MLQNFATFAPILLQLPLLLIERNLIRELREWKKRSNRKPLIIRGARQVGKTTLVKEFGKGFQHFINLNLELSKDRQFFERSDDVHLLVQFLFLDKGIPSESDDILIFIDEIHESPKAIQSLRYFKEGTTTNLMGNGENDLMLE